MARLGFGGQNSWHDMVSSLQVRAQACTAKDSRSNLAMGLFLRQQDSLSQSERAVNRQVDKSGLHDKYTSQLPTTKSILSNNNFNSDTVLLEIMWGIPGDTWKIPDDFSSFSSYVLLRG